MTAAFSRFAGRVPTNGGLVLGAGVPETVAAALPKGARCLRVGADVRLTDVEERAEGYAGQIEVGDGMPSSPHSGGRFRCSLLGRHNLDNLAAALAAISLAGIDPAGLVSQVSSFTGVGRRLQPLGVVAQGAGAGALVIDDFAHHPEEVEASAAAVRARYPGRRLVGVYQPHQVSRTESFLDGFAQAFRHFDEVLLCDIFVVRDAHPERAESASERLLAAAGDAQVRRVGPACDAGPAVLSALRPQDVCLVMGAGDIDGLASSLANGVPCP